MVLSAFGIRSASFASCLSKSRGGKGGGGPRALVAVEGATDGLRRIDSIRCPSSLSLSAYVGDRLDAGVFPAITLCARCIRPGGARGPPGSAGWAVICTGRGVGMACCCRLLRSFGPDDDAPFPLPIDLSVGSRFMLALRPIDAKNPPPPLPLLLLNDSGMLRIDGVMELTLVPPVDFAEPSFATAFTVRPCARLGYGRVGGGPSSLIPSDSDGRAERSVATYASIRLGNVTSDPIEPRETCRTLGAN